MAIKVAINGYGTIGKRVADAVDAQDDMEIVGVTKTRPAFGCDLAVRKGYPIYCTFDEQERIEAWAADPGSLGYSFVNERCCGRDYAVTYMTSLISNLGGSITFDSQIDRSGGSNSGLTLPSFYDGIKNFDVDDSGPGYSVTACTGCTMLFPKVSTGRYGGAYFRSQDLESGTTADIFSYSDIRVAYSASNTTLLDWYFDTMINKHGANQIYQSFQDQFIFAGNIFKESHWGTFANNLGDGDKSVMAGVLSLIHI